MTREKIKVQPLRKGLAHSFVGGRGLAIKVLFDEIKPGIDPLSPDNVLCFSLGPLSGTQLTMTSRIEVSTLSAYTGILGDGNGGGFFPAHLKFSGYDQVVIGGRAGRPKYLWIDDGEAELRDASELWGKTTEETTDLIVKDLGEDVKVACIGQGGENLVRFATTIFDKYHSAAVGSGAVWGSKNLKAIAVRGSKEPKIARLDEFLELVRMDRDFFMKDEFTRKIIGMYGTLYGIMHWWPLVRNSQSVLAPADVPENLKAENMKKYEIERLFCYNCVVGCGTRYKVPKGKYAADGGRIEFETLSWCGTNLGIFNPEPMFLMDILSDKYGLDVLALGHVIGLAMELYEKGIITKDDTSGQALKWGDIDTVIDLVHKIARREGYGDKLAEGAHNYARSIGAEAMKYCLHIKGPSRGPTHMPLVGLLYATSTRGADHLRGNMVASFSPSNAAYLKKLEEEGLVPKDSAGKAIVGQRAFTLSDILVRCKCGVITWPISVPLIFKYPLFGGAVKLLSAATGWSLTVRELEDILDRVYNLERAFNVRQGITRKHDVYPVRPEYANTSLGKEELKEHERMLDEYYRKRGWDIKTGVPTRETLEKLGLKYAADELESHGPYPEWNGPVRR